MCDVFDNLGNPVPPKTLNEAAQFSVCFSAAWDSKVDSRHLNPSNYVQTNCLLLNFVFKFRNSIKSKSKYISKYFGNLVFSRFLKITGVQN